VFGFLQNFEKERLILGRVQEAVTCGLESVVDDWTEAIEEHLRF
jgi:hypothetical protein